MVDKIKDSILPAVGELELSLFDIEYIREGSDFYLRIYLDKENGIGLHDIVEATRVISEILDEKDYISNEYYLEVSSPGAERPLKNEKAIEEAIGQYINVKLINPQAGYDMIDGYLISFVDNILEIEYFAKNIKKTIKIDHSNIAQARLAVKI